MHVPLHRRLGVSASDGLLANKVKSINGSRVPIRSILKNGNNKPSFQPRVDPSKPIIDNFWDNSSPIPENPNTIDNDCMVEDDDGGSKLPGSGDGVETYTAKVKSGKSPVINFRSLFFRING